MQIPIVVRNVRSAITRAVQVPPQVDSATDEPEPDDDTQPRIRSRALVSISTEHAFATGLLAALGVLTALLIGGAIADSVMIITYIGCALFLAIGLEPITGKLVQWRFPRALAIATVFLGFVAVISGVLLLVIPTIVTETQLFARQAPSLIANVQDTEWFQWVNSQFDGSAENLLSSVSDFFRDPQQWFNIAGGVLTVGAGIANGVFAAFTVTVLTLYFMASLDGMQRASSMLLPASKRHRYMTIISRVRLNVGRYMISQLLVALINSVCAYVMMSILGVRFAIILAPVIFLMALIPVIGSILCTVLTTLVSLLSGLSTAIAMAVYYLIYMQIEAYVLTPRIMQRAMPVPGIVIIIAALFGGTLMGVMGALIAIPMAASIIMIVKEIWIPRQNRL